MFGALLVASTTVGCTAPTTTPTTVAPTQSERGGGQMNEWVLTAEAESREHLADRCYYVAPLNVIEPGSKLFRECSDRANAVVTAEWKRIADAALAECSVAADDGGCCFERYVPGTEYERRLAECNSACAAQRNAATSPSRPRAACSTRNVSADGGTASRFLTPAVDKIVGQCQAGAVGSGACNVLPSYGERRLCIVNCRFHEQWWRSSRDFQAAVQRCVEANGENKTVCELDLGEEAVNAGFTSSNCTKLCDAKLQQRRATLPTQP